MISNWDEFPRPEELRMPWENTIAAISVARSNLQVNRTLDACVMPSGELVLLTECGEFYGSISPGYLEQFAEAA